MPSEESYKQIEGDWKDFRFRRITPADHAAVFENIANNFVRDEPTCKLLGWSQEFADDMNRVVELFLTHGMSFLVEHRETGKIAGVRITFHHTPDITFDSVTLNAVQTKVLLKFLVELEEKADIVNKYNVTSWAEFFLVSTSPEFRNQGIAGEFYDRSVAFLKAEGFKHVLVAVTSPYTKLATKKRGFEEASRMDYHEVTDLEGKPAFKKEELNEDHFGLVMFKTF